MNKSSLDLSHRYCREQDGEVTTYALPSQARYKGSAEATRAFAEIGTISSVTGYAPRGLPVGNRVARKCGFCDIGDSVFRKPLTTNSHTAIDLWLRRLQEYTAEVVGVAFRPSPARSPSFHRHRTLFLLDRHKTQVVVRRHLTARQESCSSAEDRLQWEILPTPAKSQGDQHKPMYCELARGKRPGSSGRNAPNEHEHRASTIRRCGKREDARSSWSKKTRRWRVLISMS